MPERCAMTPGEIWLRYHSLRRWAEKVAEDGPDMSLARFMPREAILAGHEARLAGLQARLRALRDAADAAALARRSVA